MMKITKSTNDDITVVVLLLSVFFWIMLLFDPFHLLLGGHCHGVVENASNGQVFSNLMVGWILMVFAMMLPKLITPIRHIYARSLKRKRLGLSLLFVLGYGIVWSIVGIFMNMAIMAFNVWLPHSFLPAMIVGGIAVVWQFSPIKQRFLNYGHDHRSIRAFGWGATVDAFNFGVVHGFWCFCSGWALMWFPMLLPVGHNIAMLLVTIVMISEHMEHPQTVKWRFDLRLKLIRICIAQAKLKFQQLSA